MFEFACTSEPDTPVARIAAQGYNASSMSRRIKRLLSICMLAVLGFSHASLALAVCSIERGQLSQVLASPDPAAQHDCCDESFAQGEGKIPMPANGCLSHCTADLQVFSFVDAPNLAHASIQLFVVPQADRTQVVTPKADEQPPAAVPRRILLQSFLI